MNRMPVVFIGHGSPMNAIEPNAYAESWAALARRLPVPRAIVCISAHWETRGTLVTSSPAPATVHDFYGFPKPLFDVRYPAPGSPSLAQRIQALLAPVTPVELDARRGLDHGAWGVLLPMYPQADVPVVQLSLDRARTAADALAIGAALTPLRDEGVLILGSGNIVHNLPAMDWHQAGGFAWAERFDLRVREQLVRRDLAALASHGGEDADTRRSVPTPEHYLPLLYAVGASRNEDAVEFLTPRCVLGSISMTSVVWGSG